MQREVTHGLWEKIQADEDCADDEELWELPELYHSEATHPALQLWHIRDAGSQSAGIPRLRAGECGWKYIRSTYQCVDPLSASALFPRAGCVQHGARYFL